MGFIVVAPYSISAPQLFNNDLQPNAFLSNIAQKLFLNPNGSLENPNIE
jgi:hypothetical protein